MKARLLIFSCIKFSTSIQFLISPFYITLYADQHKQINDLDQTLDLFEKSDQLHRKIGKLLYAIGEEAKLEGVYNQLHDLTEFTNPKNYKTYDELKTKLTKVLGETATAGAYTVKEEVKLNDPVPAVEPVTAEEMSSEDEDTLSYFSKLAKEDA